MEEAKKQKTKKIVNIVVNVLVFVILAVALVITIFSISSSGKGYTEMFGKAYVAVQSGSMDAEKPAQYADKVDGFKKNDIVIIKVLTDEEKQLLEEGDVITFYTVINQQRVLNSHRIVGIASNDVGAPLFYTTKGDANPTEDVSKVFLNDVVGKVEGKIGGLGWFTSSTGFLVCIVVPSFLVVIYFAFNLIREIMKQRATAQISSKEQMKEEILAQLRAEGKLADDNPPEGSPAETESAEEKPAEEKPAEVVPVAGETAEQKPAESEPIESVPVESQSAEKQSSDTKSPAIAKKPAQKKSGGTTAAKQSTNKKPAQKKSGGTATAKQSTNKKTTATKKSGGTTGSKN